MDDFYGTITAPIEVLKSKGAINLVIGIPFYNECDLIKPIIDNVIKGIESYPRNIKAAIICAGDPAGQCVIDAINSIGGNNIPITTFLMPNGVNGKGWSTRAILEIARNLHADVLMLEADIICTDEHQTYGMDQQWIHKMLDPIYNGPYSVSLASFENHFLDNPIAHCIVSPLLASIYGYRLDDPISGIWAITSDVVEEAAEQMNRHWEASVGGYGIDVFMACLEISTQQNICRIILGPKPHQHSAGKSDIVFHDIVKSFFERIKQDEPFWSKRQPFLKWPDTHGTYRGEIQSSVLSKPIDMMSAFKSDFQQFYNLLSDILPEKVLDQLERFSQPEQDVDLEWDEELWARLTYHMLISYCYPGDISTDDIISAFLALYKGYISVLTYRLTPVTPETTDGIMQQHIDSFVVYREDFLRGWEDMQSRALPLLPKISYMEFIPHVPILLPHEVSDRPGHSVNTISIYNDLLQCYVDKFNKWVYDGLGILQQASSEQVGQAISQFMDSAETLLSDLLPGALDNISGMQQYLDSISSIFPHGKVLALKPEAAQMILETFPPANLMLLNGCSSLSELLDILDPDDALAMAVLTEDDLRAQLINWFKQNGRPEYMQWSDLRLIAVRAEDFPSLKYTALDKLNGRIMVHPLPKGIGGRLPSLRYFTRIAKHIAEAEHLSVIWSDFTAQRHGFGTKVVNSISGHWGKEMFSAYNIMEDWHQEAVADAINSIAGNMADTTQAGILRHMAAGYRLGITMPDGVFMPCSAWSWASYSFKGGKGIPSPMSIHVERNAFARKLLERICLALGMDTSVILQEAIDLMQQGKAYDDLAQQLFYMDNIEDDIVSPTIRTSSTAKPLRRYEGNPIIAPIAESWWESRYTLNAAALRMDNRVYILYRAVGKDGISRLGLAITDGFNVIERLADPVFAPMMAEERRGCEDPRLVIVGERIYMTYTAFDGIIAQIAVASISIDDFIGRHFDKWQRHGMAFPSFPDKDAVIVPEKINGRYPIYHRTEPSIWVSYTPSLECPWPREDHRIIMGPRSGLMWDARKIGAGSQPIKTKYGWLMIYHGIDSHLVYRLGTMLVDLDDPGRILYRSPNPVLSPETEYEVGEKGKSWVPNVVFTCGAVPMEQKDVLDENDEIIVYYGAADTVLCVATGRVGDLIGQA